MCVGVICSCMPCFSGMLRHHLPPYEKMKSLLYVRWNSVRTTLTRHSASRSSYIEPKPNHNSQQLQWRDESDTSLAPREPKKSICSYPNTNHMGDATTTHTYINGGRDNQNDRAGGRGIHLRYDLQQSWFDASKSEDSSMTISHSSHVYESGTAGV